MTAARMRARLPAVWLVLAALVAVTIAIEWNDRAPSDANGGDTNRSADALLPAPPGDLGAVEIGHAGALHRFERNREGIWIYHGTHGNSETAHEHAADPAKAERIARDLAALGRARIERRLPVSAGAAQYGLAAPRMVIVVYRVNEPQPFAQYAVGDVAPDSFSRYVMKAGGTEVVTIANYQIENLVKLIETIGK